MTTPPQVSFSLLRKFRTLKDPIKIMERKDIILPEFLGNKDI